MKKVLVMCAALCAAFAVSAIAATPTVCTVTYSSQCETDEGWDCGTSTATIPAVPYADVLDNAEKFHNVLDRASKVQENKGPYTVQMDEVRVCDGGVPQKAQGVEVRGVTLAGANLIGREGLRSMEQIIQRFERRAARGDKHGWDHTKGKKVERDDLGNRKKDK